MTSGRFRLALFALVAPAACSWASEDECEALADKVVELGIAEVPDITEVGKAAAAQMRPRVLQSCVDRRPTKKQMACLLAAKNKPEFDAC